MDPKELVKRGYELFGIVLISLGILSLSFQDSEAFRNKKAILFALLTGLFIGLYSMIDGYGARVSMSPLSYIGFSFILNALMFPFFLKFMDIFSYYYHKNTLSAKIWAQSVHFEKNRGHPSGNPLYLEFNLDK